MIIDFLKKMRSELTDEKLKLKSEQNRIETELSRNYKFLQNLKQEEDQSYDIFSPRRKYPKIYDDDICELEEKQALLSKQSKEIQNKLDQINSRLEELDNFIKDLRKKNKDECKAEYKQQRKVNVDYERNIKSMIQKIDLCIQFLRVDPNRCKLELSAIKKILQEMQMEGSNDGSD